MMKSRAVHAAFFFDFACVYCFGVNERLRVAGLSRVVDWRGVQLGPPGPDRDALVESVEDFRRLAPEVPVQVPVSGPDTSLALEVFAWLLTVNRDQALLVKDRIFWSVWVRGRDIADPAVLMGLARRTGFPGFDLQQLDRAVTAQIVARWQAEWAASGCYGVPALVRAYHEPLIGLVTVDQLRAYLQDPASSPLSGSDEAFPPS